MIPVVTPEEMEGVDRAAEEAVEVLVERAGAAVARAAAALLGGAYGRRVVVVVGKGNNGADGRAAAARLTQRGARVQVIDAASLEGDAALPPADLVIDAAYGTGLGRAYHPPDPGGAPVLAVDIPSGLSGVTGVPAAGGGAVTAVGTVTFGALKPGLLVGEGRARAGHVEVVDIGLGALAGRAARAWLVTDADAGDIPARPLEAHKWQSAVQVVAGSPGMSGAPWLVSRAALRAGAGYVRLGIPGVTPVEAGLPPGELVGAALPAVGWEDVVVEGLHRVQALVVGPGL
ncbi:MAG: NAD(P)H-hydrate epimerase, partial [Acidimicrobiales bacterium]